MWCTLVHSHKNQYWQCIAKLTWSSGHTSPLPFEAVSGPPILTLPLCVLTPSHGFPPVFFYLLWQLLLWLRFSLSCLRSSSIGRCVPFFLAPCILLIVSCLICTSHPYSSPLHHHCAMAPCLVSCLTVQPLLPFLSPTLPALLLLCLMSLWGPIFLAVALASIVPCHIPLSVFLSSLSPPAIDNQ